MSTKKGPVLVLFVCLGNHCRSPMAQAVLRHKAELAGLSQRVIADSAGTSSYHIGEPPHSGTRKILSQNGISWDGIVGRKITGDDFEAYDYIIGMDEENIKDLNAIAGAEHRDKIVLLSQFVAGAQWTAVPDPWYTGNYALTYQLIDQGCSAIIDQVQRRELCCEG